jgi:putative glycosyltransferase (TIGR04348 family)
MSRPVTPTLVIVTPYSAAANNGNWRTAARWARLLAPHYRTIVQAADAPATGGACDDAIGLLALHARRSRAAIAAFRRAHPDRALVVVLTGTDLYRDVPAGDADACASLADAVRLIVLQEDARHFVPADARHKVDVVYQSARTLKPWTGKRPHCMHCVLVAHLRDEKDPRTVFDAWRLLPSDLPVTLTVIGAALDPALGQAARDLARADRRVRWAGPRPHAWTRQAIRRAHLLVCPSKMEGGANVVVEAITAGTPVVASRISGNLGMLGAGYAGYFPVGDVGALARLVTRIVREPSLSNTLAAQCARRAPRFTPDAERSALQKAIGRAIRAAAGGAGTMIGPAAATIGRFHERT